MSERVEKMMVQSLDDVRLAVVGLGYVGLPLAVEFGRLYPTLGFDIQASRVEELAAAEGLAVREAPQSDLERLWNLAKRSDA